MTVLGKMQVRLGHVATLNPLVPEHIRHQANTNAPFLPMEAIHEYGGFDSSRKRPVEELLSGYSYFENGDILFAKVTPCFENGKATVVSSLENGFGFGTTEVTVIRPIISKINTRYLFYILIEKHFNKLGQSFMTGAGGLKRVPDSFTKGYKFWLPDRSIQKAVADYLDYETSEIDAFIADQENLISLLIERRSATVAHCATKGLNPEASLRDSGYAWLGSIPSHWRTQRLWTLFSREKDIGHPEEPMLSVFRDYGVIFKDSRDNLNKTAENRNIYQLVGPGWLVSNRMKAWQGSVGISPYRGIVSGHYICFRPNHGEHSPYLNLLFRSAPYAAGYRSISRGVRVGQAEIDNDQYKLLPVALPPLFEQIQIVEYLNNELAELDAAISDAREAIALSKERRAALISAAVTGKIDVRNWRQSTERVLESHGIA